MDENMTLVQVAVLLLLDEMESMGRSADEIRAEMMTLAGIAAIAAVDRGATHAELVEEMGHAHRHAVAFSQTGAIVQ